MTSTDAPSHLLSLKVMRVSRPELASAWQPFYSSSPSFSTHSSASILSLQGTVPLTGHPKTLRDLTHASELLTLPAAFGSIQLGETFSSCLCVNNEVSVDVDAVSLKVEIQTANSKILLAEFGGTNHRLRVGGSLESVVNHEIKELGQHVLACSVTYHLPPGARGVPGAAEEPDDPGLQTFRKFYKFVVTNPLSVKTKVHIPKAPSALVDPSERDKVFLEIHIQNVGQQPLHFEQMHFECAENWQAKDGNIIIMAQTDGKVQEESIFSRSMTLIQPQDTRQYVYILTPETLTLLPIAHSPGSVIPLGRLNISWRSSFGEPGRLLTSMLTRRIPPAAQQQQASAVPAYLKRTVAGNHPSRPQSPQLSHSRPSTPPPPPPRVASPSPEVRIRPGSSQSVVQTPQVLSSGIEVALLIRHIPRNEIAVEKPFTVKFTLAISSLGRGQRIVKIAVQQLQPSPAISTASAEPTIEIPSPRLTSSGLNTPTSTVGAFNYAVAHQKLMSISRSLAAGEPDTSHNAQQLQANLAEGSTNQRRLPPPCFDSAGKLGLMSSMTYVGASTIFLPEVTLGREITNEADGAKSPVVQEFEVTYVPLRKGFATFGGIRALLVEDKFMATSNVQETEEATMLKGEEEKRIQMLREWDTVGEVWVAP